MTNCYFLCEREILIFKRLLRLFTLLFERKQCILVAQLTQNSVLSLHPADILQNGAMQTQRRRIVEKISFFANKKYSRSFITLRLSH